MIGIQKCFDTARLRNERILWVCQRYFPNMSLIEWTLHSSICTLKKRYGQAVVCKGGLGSRVFDGITVLDEVDSLSANLISGLQQFCPHHLVCHSSIAKDVVKVTTKFDVKVVVKLTESSFNNDGFYSCNVNDLHFFCEDRWILEAAYSKWGISSTLVRPIALPWILRARYKTNIGQILYVGSSSSPAYKAVTRVSINRNRRVVFFTNPENPGVLGRAQMLNAIYGRADALVVDSRNGDCVSYIVLGAILNEIPVIIGGNNGAEEWLNMVIQVDDPNNEVEWNSRIEEILCFPTPLVSQKRLREYVDVICRRWQSVDAYREMLS
ncbi:hypothetical protein K8T06_13480 [bacterium]|nr:hypothetical protein [bacterium]